MKNFIQHGRLLTLTIAAAFVSGALVKVGNLIGVATATGGAGTSVPVQMTGVFTLAKAGVAIAAGDPLYYNTGTGLLTNVSATGLFMVGVAAAAALVGDATVTARLDGVTRAAQP